MLVRFWLALLLALLVACATPFAGIRFDPNTGMLHVDVVSAMGAKDRLGAVNRAANRTLDCSRLRHLTGHDVA